MSGWNKVEGWSYRQAFCKIWIEDRMTYVTIDGWGIDSWYCEAKNEEEFYEQCKSYLKSDRFKEKRAALANRNKCRRCQGKGQTKQLTGFSEDDVAWDTCPSCEGTGIDRSDW